MRKRVELALTASQHAALRQHLYPGDGLEAGAVLLCGRCLATDKIRLVARELLPIPHEACERRRDFLAWPTEAFLVPLAQRMERENLSLVLAHSHPTGDRSFSSLDGQSERSILGSIYNWFDGAGPHGSAILLPDGQLVARWMTPEGQFEELGRVTIIGREIKIGEPSGILSVPSWGSRVAQTFGRGTWSLLRNLQVGVVGCSGTGSIVVEQLVRTGVGALVLIDPKNVEERNLNRILNTSMADAKAARPKVDVLADALEAVGLGTKILRLPVPLGDRQAALALASCDVVFGCVDSVEGRYILDVLSNAYLLPFFDVGVHIDPDGAGGISSAVAACHYVVPGESSLLSRGVYTAEQLSSEGQRRLGHVPVEDDGIPRYLASVGENQPAVMPLNMLAASMSVCDLLARIHGFRMADLHVQRMSLVHGSYLVEESTASCPAFTRWFGRGTAAIDDLWEEMCAA